MEMCEELEEAERTLKQLSKQEVSVMWQPKMSIQRDNRMENS